MGWTSPVLLTILKAVWLKESVVVTMVSFLPLYVFLLQFLITVCIAIVRKKALVLQEKHFSKEKL